MSQGLDRVRNAARQRKKEKFTALLHHVTAELLRDAFLALKRCAAPRVDGVTWRDYEANLEGNLQELHAKVQSGSYRALPVRRRFIPKPDGKQRPLGIAALEDKIVQRALVAVLNAIYEEDLLGFTFICGRSRRGAFQLQRKSRGDRMRAKLREVKEEVRSRMHHAIPEQGRRLRAVVTGFFAYPAVPTNARALGAFRHYVSDLWRRTLRRRSQKDHLTWQRMTKLADAWLPPPRILHPWPDQRFAVTHPR